MTLLEIIERVCPKERGIVKANIVPEGAYHADFYDKLSHIIDVLREHNVQTTVETNANGANPICVHFEKYVVSRPSHGHSSWGFEYEALLALCGLYTIWLWDDLDCGYELNHDGTLIQTWQADPG